MSSTYRICSALTVTVLFVSLALQASADTVFYDDFSDLSFTNDLPVDRDGNPVIWVPEIGKERGVDASSGDLTFRLASSMSAVVPSVQLGDTSMRTQVNAFEAVNLNLIARIGPQGFYYGGIDRLGFAYVGFSLADGTVTTIDSEQTDLLYEEEDVILQFDVFGNSLSIRAWRPGEPMPSQPLATAVDDQLTTGNPGVFFSGSGSRAGPARYRFVHVADTVIPEPSSFVLMGLACAGQLTCGRRRRLARV